MAANSSDSALSTEIQSATEALPAAPPECLAIRRLNPRTWQNDRERALLACYAWMHLTRYSDERILELFRQGRMKGTVTGAQGNEAMIIPLTLLADKDTDVVSFTHRDSGGHLIWSGTLEQHLNQYLANDGSPTRAREGNVHHGDPANRSYPMISHLGAMVSTVLGGADSQRRKGIPAVGYALFGDGGSSTGDVHESLNLASLLDLPVVFIIENNEYAYSTPTSEQYAHAELHQRAAGYGIPSKVYDGTDPVASLELFAEVIETVRTTKRPFLVEARVLRLRGHAAYDTCDYLPPGKFDDMWARDPLPAFRKRLEADGHGDTLDEIEASIRSYVEETLAICLPRPQVDPAAMEDDVYATEPRAPVEVRSDEDDLGVLNFAQALNHAHRILLERRPESLVLGQDIADYGGPFKVTENLFKKFGRERVLNTPLAESACTGYALGLAVNGHRPIVEYQFADFSTEAITQICLNAGTFHFRSGGSVPLVLRFPCGGGLTFGSFHSQELESVFLAFPGLKALYPSNPQDAFDALLAAYEDPNPVLLFEHKGLYRRLKGPVRFDPDYNRIWEPVRLREGTFATWITYGEMVHVASQVCDTFAEEYDVSFDLFDLRALSPLRLDSIRDSIARTHRLIVLHEGRRTHGFGAELVSQLTEGHFFDLEAPPLRIASMDLPVPFAPELEEVFRPGVASVSTALADWMEGR